MKDFFEQPMGFGRWPELTRRQIFTNDRKYFDQVLYKNHKFRHEYAEAYEQWAKVNGADRASRSKLLVPRIKLAIELMGEDQVRNLFSAVLNMIRSENDVSDGVDMYDTLPGARCDVDPSCAGMMETLRRFWLRLALPDVWEEDEM